MFYEYGGVKTLVYRICGSKFEDYKEMNETEDMIQSLE